MRGPVLAQCLLLGHADAAVVPLDVVPPVHAHLVAGVAKCREDACVQGRIEAVCTWVRKHHMHPHRYSAPMARATRCWKAARLFGVDAFM